MEHDLTMGPNLSNPQPRSTTAGHERVTPVVPERRAGLPAVQGLYDPANEHDACGVSFVVDMHGRRSRRLVDQAFGALCSLDHRGAKGAEANTGDGAGVLIQVPDRLYRAVVDFDLPPAGAYATGIGFLPTDPDELEESIETISKMVESEGLTLLGWREVPVDADGADLGSMARAVMPSIQQIFFSGQADDGTPLEGIDLDRRAYIVRKRVEHELRLADPDADGPATGIYFPSLSARTIIYKGMLTTPQLPAFYPDLADERLESALALVHSRFSTNTFPSWPLAHPYRYVAHNGEINTVMGNRNWMSAREELIATEALPGDIQRIFPTCTPGASDTASFDEALELLHMGGYPLPHAVLMMIPEAWENHGNMDPAKRAFYRYHSALMEPWDGPASIAFTDGSVIGAVLDRNGLRPSRYWVCEDGLVIMASEAGVVEVDQASVVEKGRLRPGRMFLVDTVAQRIVTDEEIKSDLARANPYQKWLDEHAYSLDDLPAAQTVRHDDTSLGTLQRTFGYTLEDLKFLIKPMAEAGVEALGSMGTDTPIAVLSNRSRLLYDYFSQLFAQVTNPPLDAIREELVTALRNWLGPGHNVFDSIAEACSGLDLAQPVLTNDDLARILACADDASSPIRPVILKALYDVERGGEGLAVALDELRVAASEAIAGGATVLVISDRDTSSRSAPIPALLAVAAVHHHLIRERTRLKVGVVVETGEMREVHHLSLLLGYGATAVNPYLAFETIDGLVADGSLRDTDSATARSNYIKACGKGVLKTMSKMGISTVASYNGAQVFEAVGLGEDLVEEFFTGTTSRLGGIGLDEIAAEIEGRHELAYPRNPLELAHRSLEVGGEYQWRREGEYHLFNPETVFKLQHATRTARYDVFKEYTQRVDDQARDLATLRGLFHFRTGERPPVDIEEVEPVSEIVKRFSTGAMSYGSISAEAHETLAIAMNRLGARSNTGEGGEDAVRFEVMADGDSKRSAIKQVASGRFGVTSEYLVNSDDIQIKMAQGAKPGEGGQLPGHKVYPWIAKTRHSTAGVGLISPPPHHDIYSIEDLAQLIHDLKNANSKARIHVKLVAEVGVGTVAAGVSKAKADVVLISGHDGGTGASPLSSIKHAGAPWELGLAETQQTLLLNRLRDRIVVQVDGQLKTGRDVMIAALLGAEEFGFATAPLVVSGCIMMRVCHLDTCPVGIATQNPELRSRFSGKPEFIVNFMEFVAQEVRELLAELGFRSVDEAIGHAEMLDTSDAVDHWKAAGLDLSPVLYVPELGEGEHRHQVVEQDHGLALALDQQLVELAGPALEAGTPVTIELPIRNVNRTVGTILGYEVTKRHGGKGLPDDTIVVNLTGSAGNSFGAFVPPGITLRLTGDANDYTGKGLSGGRIIVHPSDEVPFRAEENIIAGNVILYGATGGEMFLRGIVGERFCVRNSGAVAVVEGVGDHGCEYMTGGTVVVLGKTGRNFGAGMSGGVAYVYDDDGTFPSLVNPEMVDLDPLDDLDRELVADLLARHGKETGSELSARLLADWSVAVQRFVKVMPRDYKRVLQAMKQAEETGQNVDEAVMASIGR